MGLPFFADLLPMRRRLVLGVRRLVGQPLCRRGRTLPGACDIIRQPVEQAAENAEYGRVRRVVSCVSYPLGVYELWVRTSCLGNSCGQTAA